MDDSLSVRVVGDRMNQAESDRPAAISQYIQPLAFCVPPFLCVAVGWWCFSGTYSGILAKWTTFIVSGGHVAILLPFLVCWMFLSRKNRDTNGPQMTMVTLAYIIGGFATWVFAGLGAASF